MHKMMLLWYLAYILAISADILCFRVKFAKYHEHLFYFRLGEAFRVAIRLLRVAIVRVAIRHVQAFRVAMSAWASRWSLRVAMSASLREDLFRVVMPQVQDLEHLFYSRALEKNPRKTPSTTNACSIRVVIFDNTARPQIEHNLKSAQSA